MSKQRGVALITGAAKRIGRAIALDLGRSGWSVAVHYHGSRKEAQAVLKEIESSGARGCLVEGDLARIDVPRRLLDEASGVLGPVTCLVNNASVFERDDIRTLTPSSWDSHIAINLRAPVFLAQHFAALLPSGAQGNIINLIDQRVWNLSPDFLSYIVSKAGLWTATQTLAQALAPSIRVNAIGPGPTLPSKHQSEDAFERKQKSMPLQRGPTPEEICRAIRFILDAPSMTGQMIALDGGEHLEWRTRNE